MDGTPGVGGGHGVGSSVGASVTTSGGGTGAGVGSGVGHPGMDGTPGVGGGHGVDSLVGGGQTSLNLHVPVEKFSSQHITIFIVPGSAYPLVQVSPSKYHFRSWHLVGAYVQMVGAPLFQPGGDGQDPPLAGGDGHDPAAATASSLDFPPSLFPPLPYLPLEPLLPPRVDTVASPPTQCMTGVLTSVQLDARRRPPPMVQSVA